MVLPAMDAAAQVPPPPPTRADPVIETIHGVAVTDPYRWLEADSSTETRRWIEQQNVYTRTVLDGLPARETVRRRLEQLHRVDEVGLPIARGDRYFFTRRHARQQLASIVMRDGAGERVLVDPQGLSTDGRTSVDIMAVSRDGRMLAWSVRDGGADEVELRFMDVASGDEVDRLPRALYVTAAVAPDRAGVYYAVIEGGGPRLRYHRFGSPAAQDPVIFGENASPGEIIVAELSADGSRLLITVMTGASADRTRVYVQELVGLPVRHTIVDDVDARFLPVFAGGYLLLHTNHEAPNGRVLRVPLDDPRRERWEEIVPQGDGVIEAVTAAGGRVFVLTTRNVQSSITVYDVHGVFRSTLAASAPRTMSPVSGEWNGTEAFFTSTSFLVPPVIQRVQTETGAVQVWWRPDVPVDAVAYDVRQVRYPSKDGTSIPMFLVHRRGLTLDGNAPVLLTGYGGFNVSMTPAFSPEAVAWVERGGIFAVANLRGGGEFGEPWHRAGMLERKQNVFDDFIAAAEWLIAEGYTSADRLAIMGGSNGGLLVGAAMTQRPELFQAVICAVPLLDMVRYHRFLVARFWVPEYGSAEDPEQFEYLLEYSPYHNVKPGTDYPAVMFVTGDADTRVAPLHARKMTALMQAASTTAPVLLLYDTKSGHAGGTPADKAIDDGTDLLTFLLWQLGVGTGGQSERS
jgi:prolyl oligopeptidase